MASTSTDTGPTGIYFCNMLCGKPFLNDQEFDEHQKNHKSRRAVMSELRKHFPAGTTFRRSAPPRASRAPPTNSQTPPGHTNAKNEFPCTVCDKVFPNEKHQARHIRIHTGEKPYKCPTCGRGFSQECTMKRHEKIHLGDAREKNHTCDICHKSYEHRFYLAKHVRSTHNGERPHKCDSCDKAFFTSHTLRVHKRIHAGHRPYVCKICDKAFTQASRLKSHQALHAPDRHVCETCGKSFTQETFLAQHSKLHLMKNPFLCDICNQVFSTKRGLKNHKNTHDKPFLCEDCGKAFSLQGGLSSHRIKCHKTEELGDKGTNSDQTDEDQTDEDKTDTA